MGNKDKTIVLIHLYLSKLKLEHNTMGNKDKTIVLIHLYLSKLKL